MPSNPKQKVIDLVPRIFQACRRLDAIAPTTGRALSPQQAHVLDQLDAEEPTSLQALASRMGVTAPTMSVAITRLVREGYVRRSRDSVDGRRLDLTISGSGQRVRKATSALDPRRVAALLRGLSRTDLDVAMRGLSVLAEAAGKERPASGRATKRGRKRGRPAAARKAARKRGRKVARARRRAGRRRR